MLTISDYFNHIIIVLTLPYLTIRGRRFTA